MFNVTSREQSLLIEEVESKSWAAVYENCSRAFRGAFKVRFEITPSSDLFFIPRIDVLAFNRAILLGLKSDAGARDVDAIVSRYRERGVRRFFVQVSPFASPPALEDLLVEAGFRHHNNWTKWYMPLDSDMPPPAAIRITKITAAMAPAFADVVVHGFGFDEDAADLARACVGARGWSAFLAHIDGQIAGAAAGFRQGHVCGLSWAATRDEFRNRGVQMALIRHRLQYYRSQGCTLAVVETAEDMPDHPSPSYRNMKRNGFTRAYLRKNYIYEFE